MNIGRITFGPRLDPVKQERWRLVPCDPHDIVIEGIRELFALLDKVEVSDSGREFHPNCISSCRVMDGPKIKAALAKMRVVA